MAAKKNEDCEKPEIVAVTEEKFQLEELRKNCIKLFGVTSSTFAGATYNLPDGEYSIGKMKEIIETWKNKEVN